MERLVQDLRYAVRRLVRQPGFTAIAIVSLAIGIGANAAIFSLVNAIIIRDLPLAEPETLVDVYKQTAGLTHATFSYPDYRDLQRESADVFTDVAASRLAFVQTDVDDGVEVLPAELLTGNFFPLLGVTAEVGRTLLPEDDVSPGAHQVVMLGHGYWQRRYNGDPSVVGQEIRLNGRPYAIIGVAPKAYTGNLRGLTPDIYAPMMMVGHLGPSVTNELETRYNHSLFGKARLRPGVTLAQAQAGVDRIAASLQSQYPEQWLPDNIVRLVATADVIMNPMIDRVIVPAAALMMAVVALVLLIACANLASFLLAQAADRRKEVAIRLAIGANRSTLIRQFLTETVLLSGAGGLAGLLTAKALLGTLVNADLPLPFPVTLDLSLDGTVLGFGLAVTVAAGLLFGMAPALQATKADVAPTLKDESTGGGRPQRVTLRGALVVTQVAASLVLLVGAGLFLRSFQARMDIDPGFGYQPAGIMTVQITPEQYTPEEGRTFFRTMLQEAASIPGITAVGMSGDLPLSPLNNMMMDVNVDGVDPPPGQDFHLVDWAQVDPGFFAATGVRISRGRAFDQRDGADGAPVVIVSDAFARQFWPNEDPIGRVVRGDDAAYTVVGVAHEAKVRSLGEAPRPFIYRPFEQAYTANMSIVAQTTGDPHRTVLDLVALGRRLEPELLIYETKTMERHLGAMLLPHRLSAVVVSAFGLIALLLASIGLYGVVSYAVSTRKREVGIRMSLGANPGNVVRLLMRGGMRLVVIGSAIGLVASFALTRLMSGLLYGVRTTDAVAFGAVPVVLLAVATLAAWIPARRASAVNPVRALKAD